MMEKHRSSEKATSVSHPTTSKNLGRPSQRQRIIDAMIDSSAEKTYAATTISDIVSRAHISRTTFYKEFDDKRACFDAAIDHCIGQLREVGAAAQAPADAPAEAVRKAVAAVLRALAARPGLAQLLTGDAIAVDPMVIERYRRATIPAIAALWKRDGAPLSPGTDPRLAFGKIQVLVLNQIAIGKAEVLPNLLPEIVYLAISPFGGHDEAVHQAQLSREGVVEDAVLSD
jgi:AcrR family transcriptional regulator